MAHTRAWDNTRPPGTAFANTIDTEFQFFRVDTDERQMLEHYWSSSTDDTAEIGDGRHVAGKVGVLFKGTTAEIDAITGAGEGSMAEDTDTGELKRYNLSSDIWEVVPIGGVGLGPDLGVSGITPTGNFAGEDLTNAFDSNISTFSDEIAFASGTPHLIWDLGSVKNGWFFCILDVKRTAASGTTQFGVSVGYDSLTNLVTQDDVNALTHDQAHVLSTSFITKLTLLSPFIGRFVAISLGTGNSGTIRMRHLSVTGTSFTL